MANEIRRKISERLTPLAVDPPSKAAAGGEEASRSADTRAPSRAGRGGPGGAPPAPRIRHTAAALTRGQRGERLLLRDRVAPVAHRHRRRGRAAVVLGLLAQRLDRADQREAGAEGVRVDDAGGPEIAAARGRNPNPSDDRDLPCGADQRR